MIKETNIQTLGNLGIYADSGNVFAFSMGDRPAGMPFPGLNDYSSVLPYCDMQWSTIQGFNVLWRGINNAKCEEIESDIKLNRLLPRLIKKQMSMLYGQGIMPYMPTLSEDGKYSRKWMQIPDVTNWLESWKSNGMETDHRDFAKTCIKNYYTFGDFFAKFRFSAGKAFGVGRPLAGIEALENKLCRLATMRKDVAYNLISYSDFRQVAVGKWSYGNGNFLFYPRFRMDEVDSYNFAAIGHFREKSVGEFYGVNETHSGTQPYIKGSNQTARYINSFLKNSLAAKKHIKIPNMWLESKRIQIQKICDENKKRKSKGDAQILYNNIEVGSEYKESTLIEYIASEMRKISDYLSGADNQGKAYASYTYTDGKGTLQEWKIEDVDMKYKEYIEALISYDKRADEVLVSALGIDSSISNISKDGVISKSGADVYYNYLIYLMQLNPEDEICSEPFNIALQINFPSLYKQGIRLGFYRETPSRQEEVAPSQRLNNQQS